MLKPLVWLSLGFGCSLICIRHFEPISVWHLTGVPSFLIWLLQWCHNDPQGSALQTRFCFSGAITGSHSHGGILMILNATNPYAILHIFCHFCCALETVLAYRISRLLQMVSQAQNRVIKSRCGNKVCSRCFCLLTWLVLQITLYWRQQVLFSLN